MGLRYRGEVSQPCQALRGRGLRGFFLLVCIIGHEGGEPLRPVAAAAVGTDAGAYVELQGTAEGKAFSRAQLDGLLALANDGLRTLIEPQAAALAKARR